MQDVASLWTAVSGSVVYVLGTWWGRAYAFGIAVSVALFMLEEHHSIREWGDLPGLEARRGEGVFIGLTFGLLMGLIWPIWVPMLGWVGLREVHRKRRRPISQKHLPK